MEKSTNSKFSLKTVAVVITWYIDNFSILDVNAGFCTQVSCKPGSFHLL